MSGDSFVPMEGIIGPVPPEIPEQKKKRAIGELSGHEVSVGTGKSEISEEVVRTTLEAWKKAPESADLKQTVFGLLESTSGTRAPVRKTKRKHSFTPPKSLKPKTKPKSFKELSIQGCLEVLEALTTKDRSLQEVERISPLVDEIIRQLREKCTQEQITASHDDVFMAEPGEGDRLEKYQQRMDQIYIKARQSNAQVKIDGAIMLLKDREAQSQVVSEHEINEIFKMLLPFEQQKILKSLQLVDISLSNPETRKRLQGALLGLGEEELRRQVSYRSTMQVWGLYVRKNLEVPKEYMPQVDSLLRYARGNTELCAYLGSLAERNAVDDILQNLALYTSETETISPILQTVNGLMVRPEISQLISALDEFSRQTKAFEEGVLKGLRAQSSVMTPAIRDLVAFLSVDQFHVRSEVVFHPMRLQALQQLLIALHEAKALCKDAPELIAKIEGYSSQITQYIESQQRVEGTCQVAESLQIPREQQISVRDVAFLSHYASLHESLQFLAPSSDPVACDLRAMAERASQAISCMNKLTQLPSYSPGDVILTNSKIECACKGKEYKEGYLWAAAELWMGKTVPHSYVNAGYNHAAPIVSDAIDPSATSEEGPDPVTLDMNFKGLSLGRTDIMNFVVEEAYRPILTRILLPETIEALKKAWGIQDISVIEQRVQDLYRTCVFESAKALLSRKGAFVETRAIMLQTYVDSWKDFGIRSVSYIAHQMGRKFVRGKRHAFQQISLPQEIGESSVPMTCSRNTATVVCMAEEKLNEKITHILQGVPDQVWLQPTFPPEYPTRSIMPLTVRQCTDRAYVRIPPPLAIRLFVQPLS